MVSLERMSRIIDILSKRKIIATAQLEELLYCSTSTLRRDLIELEKEGKIIRSHGEVMLITANNVEYVYSARAREEEKSKQQIAEIASTFITHNQSIFIDSSTTAAMLIPHLAPFQNLRVITNGIEAARQLNNFENVTLFLSGGHIGCGTNSALGDFAANFINNFHDRYAAYEANHNQAHIKREMIANSDKAILLADHSKFNTSHYFKLSNYSSLDCIITDQPPVESFQNAVGSQCEILW